jgi:hypothetical protein
MSEEKKKVSEEKKAREEKKVRHKRMTGFALLTPERRKEVSRLGGKTCQEMGLGNQFTPETASEASRKVKNRKVFDSERGRAASRKKQTMTSKRVEEGGV